MSAEPPALPPSGEECICCANRGVLSPVKVDGQPDAMHSRLSRRSAQAVLSAMPCSYSEDDVAALSGLPGPLVSELLSRPHGPGDRGYGRDAEVYTAESVLQARIAVCMLDHGVRYRYIRAAMRASSSVSDLEAALEIWRHYQDSGLRKRAGACSRRTWWQRKVRGATSTVLRRER
jgi:hypothetical protein